jgi:hypothetical protein
MALQDSPTRKEFYRGKQVVREEWFVHDGDLVSWARLRVFSDGMADVWEHGQLWGFVNEACARFSIREGHYVHPSRVASTGETLRSEPPREQADANDQPFHWGGDWSTGLAEPGATPDPAGYLLCPVDSSAEERRQAEQGAAADGGREPGSL